MSGLTAVSLFAGVGGIDLALERSGVRVVAAVEIDPECRGVLARHFPRTALFDDVRTVTGEQIRAAGFVPERGILAAGWPCTGNSVAGRRKGLADPRSGLWVHVARLLAELSPRWFLGENVPGLYSVNNGQDIAVVRGDLAQLGYWWAERTLDAQYFGVPQRRRRVFFAGCLGDGAAPVEVLLEPESSEGDFAAGGQAGQGTSAGSPGGAGGTCSVASTLQGGGRRGHRIDAEGAAGGHLVAAPLTAGSAASPGVTPPGRRMEDDVNLIPVQAAQVAYALTARNDRNDRNDREQTWVTHALTSEGADASEDGTGRSTPIVPIGVPLQGDGTPLAFSENQRGEVLEHGYSHQLTTGGGKPGQGYPAVRAGTAVRRLTPLECERLMGLPDEWTRYQADGTEQSDSARYRQCGNAVAVPVVEWIAHRIVAVDAALSERQGAA